MQTQCEKCQALFDYQRVPDWTLCDVCRVKRAMHNAIQAIQCVEQEIARSSAPAVVTLLIDKSEKRMCEALKLMEKFHD